MIKNGVIFKRFDKKFLRCTRRV